MILCGFFNTETTSIKFYPNGISHKNLQKQITIKMKNQVNENENPIKINKNENLWFFFN